MDEILMVKISIAIPTYEMNGFGDIYLEELLKTIKIQKFTDFDVCISDHSKNNKILNICEKYASYFTIKYFKNDINFGNGPANTNSAVEMCSGKIVKIIFQDDLFIDEYSLLKINNIFDYHKSKWCLNGFTHTLDGKNHFRPMIPKWTKMMLEGQNFLGSPSGLSFLRENFLGFDENLKLLMDTDFYHRMRHEYGMPFIIEDYITSNREHSNRISSNSINYDLLIEHRDGSWLVNTDELIYVLNKNKNTRKYEN